MRVGDDERGPLLLFPGIIVGGDLQVFQQSD
jgi:hypothetical protein